MSNNLQIDVNDVVEGLLQQIAALSKENAILKAQIKVATKPKEDE